MTTRKAPPHAWPKGTSGNPRGRAPGSGEVAKLRAAIAEHVPAIIQQLVQAALSGDVQAARVLIDRVIPVLKPREEAAPLRLPDGSLTAQARAVLAAIAAGQLAPGQGAQLLAGIGTLARVVELDDLARRVALLEGKGGPRDEAA